MPEYGEYMEFHFLEGLHLDPAMLDFQPLVHPGLWRYLEELCFLIFNFLLLLYIY